MLSILIKNKIKNFIFDYITKFNFNINNFFYIEKIEGYIYNLTNKKEDKTIIDLLFLFDYIFGKKTQIKKLKSKYLKKKLKTIFIIKNNFIKKKDILYFLIYFKLIILKILSNKLNKIKYKYIKSGNYIYVEIKDLNVFRLISDNLKLNKIRISFYIYFPDKISYNLIKIFLLDFLSIKEYRKKNEIFISKRKK